MPARISRQQARETARKAFEMSLDRMIPADETKPLKGGKFIDWENQIERIAQPNVSCTRLSEYLMK